MGILCSKEKMEKIPISTPRKLHRNKAICENLSLHIWNRIKDLIYNGHLTIYLRNFDDKFFFADSRLILIKDYLNNNQLENTGLFIKNLMYIELIQKNDILLNIDGTQFNRYGTQFNQYGASLPPDVENGKKRWTLCVFLDIYDNEPK